MSMRSRSTGIWKCWTMRIERGKQQSRSKTHETNLQNLIFEREEREMSVDQIVIIFLTHKAAHCFTKCILD